MEINQTSLYYTHFYHHEKYYDGTRFYNRVYILNWKIVAKRQGISLVDGGGG